MPQIYSAAAAAVAVDDHRGLLVRLSQRNSRSNEGKTVIMNPITREYSSLPPSEVERPKNTNRSYYTACGLGFNSQSNDYKVLRSVFNYCETFNGIFDDGRPDTTSCLQSQFEIYSLKNDSWKVIPYNIGSIQGCGVYVNTGKCYWRTHHPFNSVISFDFEKESFSSPIPLPPSLRTWSIDGIDIVDDLDKFGGMDIFEYKGSLAIVGYKKLGGGGGLYTLCKAWVLKEEEQEWEEEFGVKVFGDHKPVGFEKNGQSLFLEGNYVEKKVAYQLLEYDLVDRYLKELPIFVEMSSCMQILSSSYDDLHANVFSGVVRKGFLPAANQFLQVGAKLDYRGRVNAYLSILATRPKMAEINQAHGKIGITACEFVSRHAHRAMNVNDSALYCLRYVERNISKAPMTRGLATPAEIHSYHHEVANAIYAHKTDSTTISMILASN
ncbi:hypothetical protein OROHE_006029 [Orobanche hederae]